MYKLLSDEPIDSEKFYAIVDKHGTRILRAKT